MLPRHNTGFSAFLTKFCVFWSVFYIQDQFRTLCHVIVGVFGVQGCCATGVELLRQKFLAELLWRHFLVFLLGSRIVLEVGWNWVGGVGHDLTDFYGEFWVVT